MKKLFVLVMAISFLISCQKDKDSVVPESRANHFPLTIGSYWVYQNVIIDPSGVETIYSRLDSVIISRDTIINGNQYFIFEGVIFPFNNGKWAMTDILRDSSGYIVGPKGKVEFAEDNFTEVLANYAMVDKGDTLYTISSRMEKIANPVTVPAGSFKVINCKETVNSPIPGIETPRFINSYYAENVGKVLGNIFYLSDPSVIEKRLLRYKINK